MAPFKSSAVVLAALPLVAHVANAHMMISLPTVWGGLKSDLENPLNAGTKNYFCHGEKSGKGVTTIQAGSSLSVPVVCGEAATNPSKAPSICADDPNAFHNGGGCGLSIAYTNKPGINDFTMFSVNANCPNKGNPVSFQVPANLPACDNCVCSWTWIPDPSASADEFYMNCFNCKIVSQTTGTLTGGTKLKDHMWAVPGFGTPTEERPLYKKVLPNGALKLQVGGGNGKQTPATPKQTPADDKKKAGDDKKPTGKGKPATPANKSVDTLPAPVAGPTPEPEGQEPTAPTGKTCKGGLRRRRETLKNL
ncbi:hypothetical protein SpCBS45565_g07651 [Spizellomyces sp. 'palustris']|nr:hypothetical protein SpCBS45565_g07651 [Spizellomyces sp. 'palustris']